MTPEQKLAALAVEVITSVSRDNLAKGTTYTVTVPRRRILELAAEVERQHPGWIERTRALLEARR